MSGISNRWSRQVARLRTSWGHLTPRLKWLAGTAGTVVLLAGVILGVSAISGTKSDAPGTMQLSSAQESELAYQKGLAALRAGETTAAVVSLERSVQLNPGNQDAREALARARRPVASAANGGPSEQPDSSDNGSEPEPSDGPQSEPEPAPEPEPEDSAFNKAVDDLTQLLPLESEGFVLGNVVGSDSDAAVSGVPANPDLIASRSLWTVHDRRTSAGAAEFVKSVSKSLYGKDASSTTIDGASAYFGTDGTRFATVVYVRGRYVFEVVLTSLAGSPKALRSEAEDASRAFPDEIE